MIEKRQENKMRIVVNVYADDDKAIYQKYATTPTTENELEGAIEGVDSFIKDTFAEIADEETY
jgi:hypothetical protein